MTAKQMDKMYAGKSDTYAALVARFGNWMPTRMASRFALQHGTTLAELEDELLLRGEGDERTVRISSLLAALGY